MAWTPDSPRHARDYATRRHQFHVTPNWLMPVDRWLLVEDYCRVTATPAGIYNVNVLGRSPNVQIRPDNIGELNRCLRRHSVRTRTFGPVIDAALAPDELAFSVQVTGQHQRTGDGGVVLETLNELQLGFFLGKWRDFNARWTGDVVTLDLRAAKAEAIARGRDTIDLDPTTITVPDNTVWRRGTPADDTWATVREAAQSGTPDADHFRVRAMFVQATSTYRIIRSWLTQDTSTAPTMATMRFYCAADTTLFGTPDTDLKLCGCVLDADITAATNYAAVAVIVAGAFTSTNLGGFASSHIGGGGYDYYKSDDIASWWNAAPANKCDLGFVSIYDMNDDPPIGTGQADMRIPTETDGPYFEGEELGLLARRYALPVANNPWLTW